MGTNKYLGEFPVSRPGDLPTTPAEWALEYIGRYGQIDGEHHKAWVLDQVARILHGTAVDVWEARWTNHPPEVRYKTDEPPSEAYLAWVALQRSGGYSYDEGIAP